MNICSKPKRNFFLSICKKTHILGKTPGLDGALDYLVANFVNHHTLVKLKSGWWFEYSVKNEAKICGFCELSNVSWVSYTQKVDHHTEIGFNLKKIISLSLCLSVYLLSHYLKNNQNLSIFSALQLQQLHMKEWRKNRSGFYNNGLFRV